MRYEKRIFSVIKSLIYCCIVLLIFECLVVQRVQGEEELSSLTELWRNKQYKMVALKLMEYRKRPNGRNAKVDYLLATSLCRVSEYQEFANKYFKWILHHYVDVLSQKDQALVREEMEKCSSNEQESEPIWIAAILGSKSTSRPTSSDGYAKAITKQFYNLEDENLPVVMNTVTKLRDIPFDEIKSRLTKLSDREIAISKTKELVGPEFKVISVGNFILASSSYYHDLEDLKSLGELMEKILFFFKSTYKMTIPSNFITIYIVSDELSEFAERIHGIELSDGSIGYAFQDDLSITGEIRGHEYGTLAHELFHIIVRNNFGDIPPWMEEGMAALYEACEISGSKEKGLKIKGLRNWRGPVLKEFWEMRPSILELVLMDWNIFNNRDNYSEPEKQVANHAVARYFMLYLEKENKLVRVYEAFRDRKVEEMKEGPALDAVKLLERILSKSISEVDEDFAKWFMKMYGMEIDK
jgi:hypothetical protein